MRHLLAPVLVLSVSCGCPAMLLGEQLPGMNSQSWVKVLRDDSRLRAEVSLSFAGMPNADEVFETLQKATGVRLSWGYQTEKRKAGFGFMNGKVPVWKVMELLATEHVADGKWEKGGDGYVLHGTPKDFGSRPDSEKAKSDRKVFEDARARNIKAAKDEYAAALVHNVKLHADFAKAHPLSVDAKLKAGIQVQKGATLAELLQQMRDATGLNFTLAANLTYHDPALGFVHQPKAPVFWVMEGILLYDLDDGHWVKTEEGYRLEGVSRALRAPPSTFRWEWAVGLFVVVGIATISVFLWHRRAIVPTDRQANPRDP
ncbi:MAG: hypothetical protein HYR84_14785 [Planctomycetes bacterium]|nr:hypothetical protein [Planctomycetota bacterium]